MTWDLPRQAELGGFQYQIATDFRDIFEIISYLQSDEDDDTKSLIALKLFYEDFDAIPQEYWQESADYLGDFVDCLEPHDSTSKPKLIDWEQDYNMIAAEVNKVAGCEIRSLPYLHWFTFIGYFYGIGEGQLATVCSIRKKLREHKKLEKWESEFYRDNKAKVDFQRDAPVEVEESEKMKEFWAAFNGE